MRRDSERIERYAQQGKEAFVHEELLQTWVVHHIQIIGEAARKLSDEFRARNQDIPWLEIIAMRNVLVHDYALLASRFWLAVTRQPMSHLDIWPPLCYLRCMNKLASGLSDGLAGRNPERVPANPAPSSVRLPPILTSSAPTLNTAANGPDCWARRRMSGCDWPGRPRLHVQVSMLRSREDDSHRANHDSVFDSATPPELLFSYPVLFRTTSLLTCAISSGIVKAVKD
jgi:uncharacterized protein with HEPN domain